MKALFLSAIAASVVLGYSSSVRAQEGGPDLVPAQITTTPHLDPPVEARENGLGGNVRVKVFIDAAGNVTSAEDVTGPGYVCPQIERADVVAMRNAAKEAAMLAKFKPATNKGVPVPSTNWLNFNFPGAEAINDNTYAVKGDTPNPAETNYTAVPPPDATRYTVVGSATPESDKAMPASAKTPGDPTRIPKQIEGGVLQGKAVSLPKPAYPSAARAVRAEGTVSVRVLIDEDGNLFAARAVAGHPLLRSVSVGAACGARFAPTRLSGQPVKVSGIITYNFVP
jgi:outer membrane biosynthesis protein TonB